jgi:predicted nucleic acid-binding protein
MKVALDTNVLTCAEGTSAAATRNKALELIQGLPVGAIGIPVQTLGKLFNVLVRKAARRPARARVAVLSWRDACPMIETSATYFSRRPGSDPRTRPAGVLSTP